MRGCTPKPLGSQVKREVNQANGMARCHQNHTLVDLAYLLGHSMKIGQNNNDTIIDRSLRTSDTGPTLHSRLSYTVINKQSC
jgi:hypothetical protein